MSLRRRSSFLALLAAAIAASASPARSEEGWRRDGMGVERGDFKLDLAGYVQGDLRSRRNFGADDEDAENTPTLTGTTSLLRRLRFGVEGEWGRFSYEATVDPYDEGGRLKDLFGELRLAKGLRLRGGHFKVPVSAEFLTSASKTDFIERSMIASHIGPARDWGVMARGEPHKRLLYQVGLFKGDGRTQQTRADTTAAGRVVLSPFKFLDLGASYSRGDVKVPPTASGPQPPPRGFLGRGPSGFIFYDHHFVSGMRQRLGAEAALSGGPLGARFEWLRGREERKGQGAVGDDLPDQVATGWAASATWLVTGEKKVRTVKPETRLHKGGLGAIEIAVRYESMEFDDDGPSSGFEGAGNRARNIRPAADKAFTGGVSWWPESWSRIMANVIVERFEDTLLAPVPRRAGNYVTLLGRLQFQIP